MSRRAQTSAPPSRSRLDEVLRAGIGHLRDQGAETGAYVDDILAINPGAPSANDTPLRPSADFSLQAFRTPLNFQVPMQMRNGVPAYSRAGRFKRDALDFAMNLRPFDVKHGQWAEGVLYLADANLVFTTHAPSNFAGTILGGELYGDRIVPPSAPGAPGGDALSHAHFHWSGKEGGVRSYRRLVDPTRRNVLFARPNNAVPFECLGLITPVPISADGRIYEEVSSGDQMLQLKMRFRIDILTEQIYGASKAYFDWVMGVPGSYFTREDALRADGWP